MTPRIKLVLAALLLAGCASDPAPCDNPEPCGIACTTDAQCPGGRCVVGKCDVPKPSASGPVAMRGAK